MKLIYHIGPIKFAFRDDAKLAFRSLRYASRLPADDSLYLKKREAFRRMLPFQKMTADDYFEIGKRNIGAEISVSQLATAVKLYRKQPSTISRDKKLADAYLCLAKAQRYIEEFVEGKVSHSGSDASFAKAITIYENLIKELNPRPESWKPVLSRVYFNRGLIELIYLEIHKAADYFEKAIKLDSSLSTAQSNLSKFWEEDNRALYVASRLPQ
ncbi:MAG: hypothetical protein NT051_02130 [Candidatus Micrarchaeota archaeon]|nr:hypothetical protein [Candidatus Micrarchaeota archaeon]